MIFLAGGGCGQWMMRVCPLAVTRLDEGEMKEDSGRKGCAILPPLALTSGVCCAACAGASCGCAGPLLRGSGGGLGGPGEAAAAIVTSRFLGPRNHGHVSCCSYEQLWALSSASSPLPAHAHASCTAAARPGRWVAHDSAPWKSPCKSHVCGCMLRMLIAWDCVCLPFAFLCDRISRRSDRHVSSLATSIMMP